MSEVSVYLHSPTATPLPHSLYKEVSQHFFPVNCIFISLINIIWALLAGRWACYVDFNFTPNHPWINKGEESLGAYPTTLHAKASVNGIEQESIFEFENFGMGMTGLMSIINSDEVKRPPILLTQEHLAGTSIENHPLVEKCLGTFVNSSTTFTRKDLLSANKDQILAFELATEEMQSINFEGKLLYTDENEMN